MRELKAEKHRDFKITTHISPRLQQQTQQRKPSNEAEENDENFFSLFDDVESELQSGASSSMSQMAMMKSLNNSENSNNQQHQPDTSVMLARAIARAGFCSRRAAINLVASGKVKVDGVVQRNPFEKIHAHNDIHVEGHRGRLRFTAPRLWAFHKPSFVPISSNPVDANYTSNNRTKDQFAMWERYSQMVGVDHLMPVGAMPMRCHGLLMLTNDGELARWLEHGSTRVQSTWIFRVRPPIDPSLALTLNTNGVRIGDETRREFQFINFTGGRSRHAIRIKVQSPETEQQQQQQQGKKDFESDEQDEAEDQEGKDSSSDRKKDPRHHHQQRNSKRNPSSPMPVTQMLEAINRRVVRGGRVGYGPFTLRGLPPGGIREVPVPPYYMKFINPIWAPFIERDWPYFRRDRVRKLMRMARWRHLNDKEQEEIEAFSCDELRAAFSGGADGSNARINGNFSSPIHAEIEQEAQKFAEAIATEPNIQFSNTSNNSDEGDSTQQHVVDFEDIARKTTNDSKMIQWKF